MLWSLLYINFCSVIIVLLERALLLKLQKLFNDALTVSVFLVGGTNG
jgi:hypothetical protein